ncbi:hypothetical protein JYU08_00265 [bacterium AH-315-B06]|nr:hypothetical protein [bacterium AH-315-B06]
MSETPAKHEQYAGKDLGEIAFICIPTMVEHYCEGLAVDRARYLSPTYWEKPAAPAMIVSDARGGIGGWIDFYNNRRPISRRRPCAMRSYRHAPP